MLFLWIPVCIHYVYIICILYTLYIMYTVYDYICTCCCMRLQVHVLWVGSMPNRIYIRITISIAADLPRLACGMKQPVVDDRTMVLM